MRNLCKILRKKDVGAIGIGAMIVFIAMVLVAGIAASVLVQTANKLEIQAMVTGDETTAEVATGIGVEDIEGYKSLRQMEYNTTTGKWWNISDDDGDANTSATHGWKNYTRIQNMTITVSPRAGSKDIDLSKTVVEISNSTVKCILTYDSTEHATAASASGVFATDCFDGGPDDFGVIVLEDADSSAATAATPVINRGDHVMICINLSVCFWGLAERTDVWGMVIPEEGAPGVFAFRTPASYSDTVFDLY